MDTTKVEATLNWPRSIYVIDVRSLIGVAGYYRRFIEAFSKLAIHIIKLLPKNKFEWMGECEVSS